MPLLADAVSAEPAKDAASAALDVVRAGGMSDSEAVRTALKKRRHAAEYARDPRRSLS
jgi:hypothetical protein